jgi:xanthine dehydrogenase accessory factor
MTSVELLRVLSDAVAAGKPASLVTVTGFSGSAPREIGAKMVVLGDGAFFGTIGGGRLEAQATLDAVAAAADGRSCRKTYELEPRALGMYCGGTAEVFIDVYSETTKLVILGGGHVGEKTGELAAFLNIPHWVVDDRPEYANRARFPHAREVLVAQPDEALKRLAVDGKTAVAIVTRCHGFDLRCLVAALQTPAFYVGMIGSRTKTKRLFDLCLRRGLDPASDPRVRAPIGLDLGGRTPEEIALSILAEITQLRHGATGLPLAQSLSARTTP